MVHLNRNKSALSKTSKIFIKDSSKLKLFICGNAFSKQIEIKKLLTKLGFQSKNIFHGPRDLGKFKKINNSSLSQFTSSKVVTKNSKKNSNYIFFLYKFIYSIEN